MGGLSFICYAVGKIVNLTAHFVREFAKTDWRRRAIASFESFSASMMFLLWLDGVRAALVLRKCLAACNVTM